ncbi:MAG: FKBP-type peptidyl-prolyl cis-trans isomerase [Marinifilaceae bacterium]|nr:FKBP-type peptidyl-prolyl cis-trans isomerase [Marinifilaceae bacterium]
MKIKNFVLGLSVATLGLSSCTNINSTTATLSTKADTANYYIGYMYGSGLLKSGITNPNMNAIIAGVNSALQKKDAPADMMQMNAYVSEYVQGLMMEKAKEAEAKGKAFLEENAKKEGVKTTESGLQYKIEKQGEGAIPADTSIVSVHYKGTLIDGTEFDSSYKRNEPAQFPVNRVIAGWTEALKMMPVGSKWTLYIPSNLGYGARGAGQLIGPNETLIFEVELLDIVSPEEQK